MRRVFAALALVVALLVQPVLPPPALAAWPASGQAICTAPDDQGDANVSADGAGGAIVTWQDFGPGPVDVFAQHVLASGALDPAWPVDGLPLLTDPEALAGLAGGQLFPVIVADGGGGAVVAWQDARSSTSGVDIYAQHVLASGQVDGRWPANGAALCTAPGTQNNLVLVSDGGGGAVAAWMDGRGSTSGVDIYAQHLLASGAADPTWPADGVAVCTAPERQAIPQIVGDGAGGAIVTWYDFRSRGVTGIDVYAQHVLSAGVVDPAWPVNGRALCTAADGQIDPTIVSDGAHGAIVTWVDAREPLGDIYAQHVLASGAIDPAWPVDGLAVCAQPDEQIRPILVSDEVGGAIVSWEDQRSGVHNAYAQHVLAAGVVDPGWPVNGRALSTSAMDQAAGVIVPDGAGGAMVSWQEGFDISAQHVLASGALDPAFPAVGRPVIAVPGVQDAPSMVATGPGLAIIAWTDLRSGSTSDVYAQQLNAVDATGVGDQGPGRGVTFAPPSPNPASTAVMLQFALPRDGRAQLDIYDAAGRRVRHLSSGAQGTGAHVVAWDLCDESGQQVCAGLYFARLQVGGQTFTRKLAKLN